MKKIMIAVAIVCAAAFAQAASCSWTSYAYDSTMMTALEGGSFWVVSLGTSDAGLSSLVVKQDGTVDFGSYSTVDSGSIAAGSYGGISGEIGSLTEADNGTYYALVVWDGVTGEGGYYGSSVAKIEGIVADPPTDAKSVAFDNTGMGYGMTLATTATEAVPEPTSGLLLLLGVAGLALRRRRA